MQFFKWGKDPIPNQTPAPRSGGADVVASPSKESAQASLIPQHQTRESLNPTRLKELSKETEKSRNLTIYVHSTAGVRGHLGKLHSQLKSRVVSVASSKGVSVDFYDFKLPKRKETGQESPEICAKSLVYAYKSDYFISFFDEGWKNHSENMPSLYSYKGPLNEEEAVKKYNKSQLTNSLESHLGLASSSSSSISKVFLGLCTSQGRGTRHAFGHLAELPKGFSPYSSNNVDELIEVIVSSVCSSIGDDFSDPDAFERSGSLYSSYLRKINSVYPREHHVINTLKQKVEELSKKSSETPVLIIEGDHASYSSSIMAYLSEEPSSGFFQKSSISVPVCLSVSEEEVKLEKVILYVASEILRQKKSGSKEFQIDAEVYDKGWGYIHELAKKYSTKVTVFIHDVDQLHPSSMFKDPQSLEWVPQGSPDLVFVLSRPSTFLQRRPLAAGKNIAVHTLYPISEPSFLAVIRGSVTNAEFTSRDADNAEKKFKLTGPSTRYLVDIQLDLLLKYHGQDDTPFETKLDSILSLSLSKLMSRYIESWTKLFGESIRSVLYLLSHTYIGVHTSILTSLASITPEMNDILASFIPFMSTFVTASQKKVQFRSPVIANAVGIALGTFNAEDQTVVSYIDGIRQISRAKPAAATELLVLALKSGNYDIFVTEVLQLGFIDEWAHYLINNEWSLCLQGFFAMKSTTSVSEFMKRTLNHESCTYWPKIISLVHEVEGLKSALELVKLVKPTSGEQLIADFWTVREFSASGKFEEAIAILDAPLKAMKEAPDGIRNAALAEGLALLGSFHCKMGRYTEAIAHFKNAYEAAQKLNDIECTLSILLNLTISLVEGGLNRRETEAYIDECRKKLSLLTFESKIFECQYQYILGKSLQKNGRYREAVAQYTVIISTLEKKFNHPRFTSAIYASITECCEKLQRPSEVKEYAKFAYEEVLKYDKKSVEYAIISVLYGYSILKERPEEARMQFAEAQVLFDKYGLDTTKEAVLSKCDLIILSTQPNIESFTESLENLKQLDKKCASITPTETREMAKRRIEIQMLYLYSQILMSLVNSEMMEKYKAIIPQSFKLAQEIKKERTSQHDSQVVRFLCEIFTFVALHTYNELTGASEQEQQRNASAIQFSNVKDVMEQLEWVVSKESKHPIGKSLLLVGLRTHGHFHLELLQEKSPELAASSFIRIIEIAKEESINDAELMMDTHESLGRAYLEYNPSPKYVSALVTFKKAEEFAKQAKKDEATLKVIRQCIEYAEFYQHKEKATKAGARK